MPQSSPTPALPRAQRLAERAFATLERFLHVEAVGGVLLLLAAAAALLLANSPWSAHYESFWHIPLGVQLGSFGFARSLHFWINDGLMTLFFLVVGMEIRREIHEGALSQLRQAALPVAAAIGGVLVPALLYLALNPRGSAQHGWAIPTATDIAFATGMLALLGRTIPSNLRVFLLALAIIDDIIAVLVIALFYSVGLDYVGFLLAGGGLLLAWGLQRMGIGAAQAYIVPGVVVWTGLLIAGIHPTLAGVALGLITPVRAMPMRAHPDELVSRMTREVLERKSDPTADPAHLARPLRALRVAQRELSPPVVRVQNALHPWVAYLIMPVFAFANAGVTLGGVSLTEAEPRRILLGVCLALVLGKPLGVFGVSWLLVRLGWCRLPPGLGWSGMGLIGLLAGVGFTMSIFIAMLAFAEQGQLAAAKLGVLLASLLASALGLAWGAWYVRGLKIKRAVE